MPELPKLKRRLILEAELPEMNVDDIPELLAEYGGHADLSEEILHEIGDIDSGLLIVRTIGEKSAEIVTVPIIFKAARIEDEAPTPREQWGPSIDGLVNEVDPEEDHRLPNLWTGS